MLGLKLNHVSKRGHWYVQIWCIYDVYIILVTRYKICKYHVTQPNMCQGNLRSFVQDLLLLFIIRLIYLSYWGMNKISALKKVLKRFSLVYLLTMYSRGQTAVTWSIVQAMTLSWRGNKPVTERMITQSNYSPSFKTAARPRMIISRTFFVC